MLFLTIVLSKDNHLNGNSKLYNTLKLKHHPLDKTSVYNTSHSCLRFVFQSSLMSFIIGFKL